VSLSDGVGSAATVSAGLVSGVVAVVGASLVVVGVSGSVSLPSATPSARARRKAASSSDDPPDVSVGTVVVVAGSVGAVSIVPVSTSVVVGAVSVVTVSITVVVAGCVVVVGSVTVVGDADVVAGDVSVELGRVGSVSDPVGRVTPLSDGSPEPSPPQPPRRYPATAATTSSGATRRALPLMRDRRKSSEGLRSFPEGFQLLGHVSQPSSRF
jgi:hypothetical protein